MRSARTSITSLHFPSRCELPYPVRSVFTIIVLVCYKCKHPSGLCLARANAEGPLKLVSLNNLGELPNTNFEFTMDSYRPTRNSSQGHYSVLDTTLPKNFKKPLTCFFWLNFGTCNKRDIDCAYAHYDTGYAAAGPISLPGDSVAGKNAQRFMSPNGNVERELRNREMALRKREEALKLKEEAMAKQEDGWKRRMNMEAKRLAARKKNLSLREKLLQQSIRKASLSEAQDDRVGDAVRSTPRQGHNVTE